MTVWKLIDRPVADEPDRRKGWAIAAIAEEAIALTDCPTVLAVEYPAKLWPGDVGAILEWSFKKPVVDFLS